MIDELWIKILTLVLLLVFFIIRGRFIQNDKRFTPRRLVKYVLAVILFAFYFFGYFDFANFGMDIYIRLILGLIIIVLSMILIFVSHKHLKDNWSSIMEKKFPKSKRLITSGPYEHIRHPIYFSSLVALVGFFVLTSNWLLISIPLAIFIVFYCLKIPKEEKALVQNFGKKDTNYKKKTGGLFPKLK